MANSTMEREERINILRDISLRTYQNKNTNILYMMRFIRNAFSKIEKKFHCFNYFSLAHYIKFFRHVFDQVIKIPKLYILFYMRN